MNISGILVQTTPGQTAAVVKAIKQSKQWEYHLHDDLGRIIVTLDGDSTEEEIQKLKQLRQLEGVLAADMVYSYSEEELDKLRDDIDQGAKVQPWLNDENIRAEQIRYNGDLKKKYTY